MLCCPLRARHQQVLLHAPPTAGSSSEWHAVVNITELLKQELRDRNWQVGALC
jgi:hypothetical protein